MGTELDILLCTDYLPPSDGGVEQVVDHLARRLANRGYNVGVFTLTGENETIQLRDHSDVSVFTSKRIKLTDYIGLQSAVAPAAIRDYKRVVENTSPSIVHVHNRFFFTSLLGLMYKYYYKYPLVTTLHLGELNHLGGLAGSAASLYQLIFSRHLVTRCDAVICVSEAVQSVSFDLGASPDKTTVIPNAIDLTEIKIPQSEFDKTLLYAGRLVRNNGPQDLLEAAPNILESHPDAQIHMVGDGTLKNELKAQKISLGIEDGVRIHGFVDDIMEWYAKADVFCRPSYSEGLPLTLLESMATYTVPVVTPVAGSTEVVTDDSTGQFVPVGDPDVIAEVVTDLFNQPEKINQMANAARTHVEEHHSWNQRIEKIISIYEQL